jgi:hypothetical protein
MPDLIKLSGKDLDNDFAKEAAIEEEFLRRAQGLDVQEAAVAPARKASVQAAAQTPSRTVFISNKDVRVRLKALDVSVSDDQIAVMLPEEASIDEPRFKAKFTLEEGADSYQVMYIGGCFYFAELRVRMLCFVRIAAK